MSHDARGSCPGCQPDVDPQEELVVVDWCEWHRPKMAGSMDALVGPMPAGFTLGTGEAKGIPNAAMCALLHARAVR